MEKSESRIQQEIFQWFWNNYCLPKSNPREVMFHVPNEGQHKLINIGVLAGVSDLVFTFKGVTYYCEVKTPSGRLSKSQLRFQDHIGAVYGSQYFVCRSIEDFKSFIFDLLN